MKGYTFNNRRRSIYDTVLYTLKLRTLYSDRNDRRFSNIRTRVSSRRCVHCTATVRLIANERFVFFTVMEKVGVRDLQANPSVPVGDSELHVSRTTGTELLRCGYCSEMMDVGGTKLPRALQHETPGE